MRVDSVIVSIELRGIAGGSASGRALDGSSGKCVSWRLVPVCWNRCDLRESLRERATSQTWFSLCARHLFPRIVDLSPPRFANSPARIGQMFIVLFFSPNTFEKVS